MSEEAKPARRIQIFETEKDVLYTDSKQVMIDAGINAFAVDLLAESFAFERVKWSGKALVLVGYGKDKQAVYITVTSQVPIVLEASGG